MDAQNKILLSGIIDFYDGVAQPNLIRLNADGTLDTTFNSNTKTRFSDLALLSTGEIIGVTLDSIYKISSLGFFIKAIKMESYTNIAINDDNIYTVSRASGLKKYDSSLNLDTIFKQDNIFSDGNTDFVAIQGDHILVGGSFTEVNGVTKNLISRFDTNGNLDNTFETNYTGSSISGLMVQNDGKILVNNGGLRLDSNGLLDSTYATPVGVGNSFSALLQNDKILMVAFFDEGLTSKVRLIRLNNDGSLDNSFNMVYAGTDYEMALSGDNSLLTGSLLYNIGFKKYNSEGVLVSEFTPPISSIGYFENAVSSNGSIIVSGDFYALNDHNTYQIGKIDITGAVDYNFTVTPDIVPNRPTELKIKGDDQIFVTQGNKLLKLDHNGNLVSGFNTPTGLTRPNSVYKDSYFAAKFEFLENGQIITAGPNGVYLLNPNGTQDTAFSYTKTGGGSSTTFGLDLQSSGKIINGNIFTEINNIPSNGLVRLFPDGKLDESFIIGDGPDAGTRVRDVHVLQNDEIIVRAYNPRELAENPNVSSGGFNTLSSNLEIYKLNVNGNLDTDFLNNINSNFSEASHYRIGISYMDDSFIFNYSDYSASKPFSFAKIDLSGNKDNNFSFEKDINIKVVNRGNVLSNVGDRMVLIFGDIELKATGDMRKGALFIDEGAPIVTGTVANLTTAQDAPIQISATDLVIEDADNAFPEDFHLTVLAGKNYTVSNNTVTPSLGFVGSLSINLVVNDGKGNSQPFQINVEVTESLGIENEFLKNHFLVYPNPFENKLNIRSNNLIDAYKVKISDTNGRLIYSNDTIKNEVDTINLGLLHNGLYILQIISGDKVGTMKLLKI